MLRGLSQLRLRRQMTLSTHSECNLISVNQRKKTSWLLESKEREMGDQTVFESFPWITQEFVKSIVEESEPNNCITIKSFDVSVDFKNGECFCSDMVSLKVVYTHISNKSGQIEKQKNFLVKIAIATEDMVKISEECHFFEREAEAYTNVLPVLEKCFRSVGIIDRIAPK